MKTILIAGAFALSLHLSCTAADAAPLVVDFGDATLRDWVQPEYPDAARKQKLEGTVRVEFVVEADGRVSRVEAKKSSAELFEAAAVAAVGRWTFAPALEEAKPVASAMGVTVPFQLAQLKQKVVPTAPPGVRFMPAPLKSTPAKVKSLPDPDYPDELADKKLPGEVEIEFAIDAEGHSRNPRVVRASHAAFVETALRAVERGQFEPARQGPLPKGSTMQYPMSFESMGVKRAEIYEANRITTTNRPAPVELPKILVLIDPVYPRERLLANEQGSAVVEFGVGENGRAADVSLVSATAPEFGAAMVAAVEAWIFAPVVSEGGVQPLRLRVVHDFAPPVSGADARLAGDMRPGAAGVKGAAGLDQKLKPLWRGFPVYPHALLAARPTGEAKIDFIVDRDGRARLPGIVSASKEEFGWAAATAISQWVFERPFRQGEPVDARVSITVSFTPPPPDA